MAATTTSGCQSATGHTKEARPRADLQGTLRPPGNMPSLCGHKDIHGCRDRSCVPPRKEAGDRRSLERLGGT